MRKTLSKEPEGYSLLGAWFRKDDQHPAGSNKIIDISRLQKGFGNGQNVNFSCSILASAAGNARVKVGKDGKTALFNLFHPTTGRIIPIEVTTRLRGTDASGVLGWLEKAYAVWLKKVGLVKLGKTAWQELVDGSFPAESIKAFTNHDAVNVIKPTLEEIETARLTGRTAVVWTYQANNPVLEYNHAYRVIGSSSDMVLLQNPWGRDGKFAWGNPNDGIVGMNREQWDGSQMIATVG